MPKYICKIGFNVYYKCKLARINSRCVTKCGETNKE